MDDRSARYLGDIGFKIDLETVEKSQMMGDFEEAPMEQCKFEVRVTEEQLQKELGLYAWRQKIDRPIIPILSYEILSQPTHLQQSFLLRIIVPSFKHTIQDLPPLCLTQCLLLLKQLFESLLILIQKFGSLSIESKMIAFDENHSMFIWASSQYHLNPSNSLYPFAHKVASQKETVTSVLTRVESKCLQTHSIKQLFKLLRQQNTINGALLATKFYLQQKKLILPEKIITSPMNPLLSSNKASIRLPSHPSLQSSLYFSIKGLDSLAMKKDSPFQKKEQQNKNSSIHIENTTRANSGFISLNPEEKQSPTKTYQSSIKYSGFSSNENLQSKSSQINPKSTSSLDKEESKKNLSLKSCVFSETISNEPTTKKFGFEEIFNGFKVQYEENCLVSEKLSQDQDDPESHSKEIISMNGWQNQGNWMLMSSNCGLKQSFTEGTQEQTYLKDFQLKKLHTMGRNIRESFLPVEEDVSEEA